MFYTVLSRIKFEKFDVNKTQIHLNVNLSPVIANTSLENKLKSVYIFHLTRKKS